MEDPPDHAIPQFGDTLHYVLDRQAEWQKTGILALDPVIKQSHSDGCPLLGVVRMDDCIHQRLPDCPAGIQASGNRAKLSLPKRSSPPIVGA